MSVETSRMTQPGDGDPNDGQRRFTFRSADSAADQADLDDDLGDNDLDDDAASRDDETAADDEGVVRGTVVDEDAADRDAVAADGDDPQPTFTPVADGPAADPPAAGTPDPTEPTLSETDDVPVVPAQAAAPVTEAPVAETAAVRAPLPPVAAVAAVGAVGAVGADQPLLGDAVGLRASWQQAQAGFVDDPQAAVADAAELVEHTAQTLIGALQQRQRQLRTQWDNNGSAGPAEPSDTEQLRHLMQDYRSLFNQLCRP